MGAHYHNPSKHNHNPIHFGPMMIGMTILICFVYIITWAQTLITHGPARNLRAY